MSHEEQTRWKRAMLVWTGLAVLVPVVAVGWMTRGAIEDIKAASNDAVARVEKSVAAVAHAQELHSATDRLETDEIKRRVDDLEEWRSARVGRVEAMSRREPGLPVSRENPRGLP